jgi:hypothetical protein
LFLPPTGESYTDDEYELLTEADRSQLVRKTITNRVGRKQVVWVRATDANRGETKTRQQLADVRTLVAKAVADPNSLNPEQFAALASHLETVNRDDIRGLLKQVKEKVGGTKAELADRLVQKVKAGRTGGVGSALKDEPEFVEPNNLVKGVDTQTASSNNTSVPRQPTGATGGKEMDTTTTSEPKRYAIISDKWLAQQRAFAAHMANQEEKAAKLAEIDAAEQQHEDTLDALDAAGFIRNRYPFTAKNGNRIQGGYGWAVKRDGKWINMTNAEAVAELNAKRDAQ